VNDVDDFTALIVNENRRLRLEVERLRAIETSRWWRLNPRSHARHVASLLRPHGRGTQPAPAEHPSQPVVGSTTRSRFRHEVVERGSFSHDWFTRVVASWEPLLSELDGRAARVLEIGSFEGLSACFVLWRLPDSAVTCVDTFEGSAEHVARDLLPPAGLEAVFDANVALVDASRVRKIVGDSRRVLVDLLDEGARFDLIYVDGSHVALDVIVDAALAWRLLANGGFIVFDDYDWSALGDDRLLRPGPAVDSFLSLVDGRYELVSKDVQLIVRKTEA
jgi:predicted O-methyltransferase YrrM